jgi:hypothetical protein
MTSRPVPVLRATARRSLGVLAAALVIAGCTPPAARESQSPADSQAASPSASEAQPTASIGTPSASPSLHTGFDYSDILRVEVNGLAVRQAPSLTSPLAQGYRGSELITAQPTGDVRIDAGYFVRVELGPLWNGDTAWYLVWPAEDARLHNNTGTWWDSNGDFATGGGVDPGWVAASVGENLYLTLYRQPEPGEIEQYRWIEQGFLMVSGTGNYESGPQARHDLFGFNWVVAVDGHFSPCPFSISLVPEDGAEPVVVIQTSTTDVEQGPVTGPGSQIELPWGSSAGGTWDSFAVSINSGCTWAVGLWPAAHD